jgi:DNA-binding response OmpR family regulator
MKSADDERTVDVNIRRLRAKLGTAGCYQRIISRTY